MEWREQRTSVLCEVMQEPDVMMRFNPTTPATAAGRVRA